jgi:hypothetical protein
MARLQKFLLSAGAVLALCLLILAAPRTVQAVAAALVQVTNTASNPVVTQTTGAQATNTLHLNCAFNLVPERNTPCWQITSSGTVNADPGIPYTVPAGSNFVITAVDVFPAPNGGGTAACPGVYVASIGNLSSPLNPISFLSLATSNVSVTTHFTYPPSSGIVIGPSTGVYANGYILNAATGQFAGNCANSSLDVVDLYGYLTTD